MGFFDWFSGKPGRYVTERAYAKNLALQLEMTPMTVQVLQQHGVTSVTKKELTYFFTTNTVEKAEALAVRLKAFGYAVEVGRSHSNKKLQTIQGKTRAMLMGHEVVLAWTRKMCEVGYSNDCAFDGWEASGPF